MALWCLGFGILLVFGIWSLEFGLHRSPKPPTVPLTTIDPSLARIITTARTAVVSAPRSGLAWGQFGQALHAAEFNPEARGCYSNAAKLDPKNFRWPYLLGLLEMQDQPEAALQHLVRATELAGGQTDAPRYQLARALVERGRYEEATPHLQQLLAANPQHAAARLELARVLVARQAFQEATQELQAAVTNQYTMRAALLIVAQITQRQGQPDRAAEISLRAAALPRSFDWPDPVLRDVQNLRTDRARLADQANALLQQQRTREAGAAITRLLEAFPDDAEGLLLLGRLHYVERRCPEAETAFRKHLAVQPDSLNGLIQLSLSLLCQKQWTNACISLERAVALKPDFAQAHFNLGRARSQAGDSAGSIRAFRDALRCHPGDINTHIALAEELANAGEVESAKRHVESATVLNPNDARVKRAREQLGLK